jgi:hypothetical protein
VIYDSGHAAAKYNVHLTKAEKKRQLSDKNDKAFIDRRCRATINGKKKDSLHIFADLKLWPVKSQFNFKKICGAVGLWLSALNFLTTFVSINLSKHKKKNDLWHLLYLCVEGLSFLLVAECRMSTVMFQL